MNKTDAQNPVVIKLTAESQYWFDRSQQLQDALADSQERHADLRVQYDALLQRTEDYSTRLNLIAELHRVSDKIGFRPRMNPGAVTDNGIQELIADAKAFKEVVLLSDVSAAVGFERPGKNAAKADWQKYAETLETGIRQVRAKYHRNKR